jgi:preprotein translocase subunit SecA
MTLPSLAVQGRLARSIYPEREDKNLSAPDQFALGLVARLRRMATPGAAGEVARLQRALQHGQAQRRALDDRALLDALRRCAPAAVQQLRTRELHEALLLVAEAARRALGMQPYATQLVGAATLLRGRLAEMNTGEGKTLTAGLAACVAALAGVPVHVVTVNDYLAHRDADKLRPLFELAGLSVGVVVHDTAVEAKRAAYASDICYCTNKDLVFDYLRDRVAVGGRASAAQLRARQLFDRSATQPPLLRGLHLAIVDEADSILIDEARTPLILAEKAGAIDHAAAFAQALEWAALFEAPRDHVIDAGRRELHLSTAGRQRLAELCAGRGDPWRAAHAREHLLTQALRALHLFKRDQQYLVDADGKVQIIDEYTGRVLPGRTWEGGLHQMIETKEGVELSEHTQTLARITYQRFFSRYLRLAGMTGTAREMAQELDAVYRLRAVGIPSHRPSARRQLPDQVLPDEARKWQAVAQAVAALHARGQPVLVGTRSVVASERLSQVLTEHGLVHAVLNARQDADEAALVAAAGERGAITVATNMAGRGTDIGLGPGVAELGGLCVILTEYHESPRIDRQLIGRCARQGDPGTCMAIVALDDELFRQHGGPELALLRKVFGSQPQAVQTWVARCRRAAQARAEAMHARTRRDTLRQDRNLDQLMSFSGDPL